jgi:hypothetical protein
MTKTLGLYRIGDAAVLVKYLDFDIEVIVSSDDYRVFRFSPSYSELPNQRELIEKRKRIVAYKATSAAA